MDECENGLSKTDWENTRSRRLAHLLSTKHSSSFRDPSGFIFTSEDRLYRQVNKVYAECFEALNESGLLESLFEQKLLVRHKEVSAESPNPGLLHKIIQPDTIPRISYPYEWAFSQLKDAALLTLKIMKKALDAGFILKDASAFNVQFLEGKAIFIDTLSFERYEENRPWIAYRQFCEHFYAPLALRSQTSDLINPLLNANIEGIPLDLASKLLPGKTKFNPGIQMHIHLHAKSTRISTAKVDDEGSSKSITRAKLPKKRLYTIVESLKAGIQGLKPNFAGFDWSEYYANTNYPETAMLSKIAGVEQIIKGRDFNSAIDLGANTGRFSELLAKHIDDVVAVDQDSASIEALYSKPGKQENILPLVIDLANPSPSCGFSSRERDSFLDRYKCDLSMSLALVHHLAIGNNLPFELIADFHSEISDYALVEWIPKSDSRVQLLLRSREDIFQSYNEVSFLSAFESRFSILDELPIEGSGRKLFLFKKS